MYNSNAKAKRKWRKRKKQGLVVEKYCQTCDKKMRSQSRDICRQCWLKTDKGKEYLAKKKRESRSKN